MESKMLETCRICGDKNFPSECPEGNESVKTLNQFIQQLGLEGQQQELTNCAEVRLCGKCFSGVKKATQWRKMDDVERDVRSLQRIIVKMMRQLTSFQSSYLEEMKGLELRINKSEEASSARGKRRLRERNSSHGNASLKQGILDALKDLGAYQHDLSSVATEQNDLPISPPLQENNNIKVRRSTTTEPVNILELPSLVLKHDVNTCGVEQASPPGEDDALNLDPLSTENFDIEYHIYTENITKSESIPMEADVSVPTTSTSASMTITKRKAHRRYGPCEYCGKSFQSLKYLQVHGYTHTGERPLKCHLCPLGFRTKHDLERHLLIHSGKKPFKCPRCKKVFSRKDTMEEHRRRHTGAKRFSCFVCGQSFTNKRSMKTHLKKNHPNEADD